MSKMSSKHRSADDLPETSEFHPTDPETLDELDALTDPLDRADALMALEMLEKAEKDGTIPWEEAKAELGWE